MTGISEGGSYSRDPKTGALTRRTEPAAEAAPAVTPAEQPAEAKAPASKPKKES